MRFQQLLFKVIPAAALAFFVTTPKPAFGDDFYSFAQIDYPNHLFGTDTYATGINDLGQIVGFYQAVNGPGGYLLSGGTFSPISVPGAAFTSAQTINNSGQILGWYDEAGVVHNFVLSGGVLSTLPPPPGLIGVGFFAQDVNNNGAIVGFYGNPNGPFTGNETSIGYLQNGTSVTTFGAPGSNVTQPHGLNDLDNIVGGYLDSQLFEHGFFLTAGGHFVTLDVPGGLDSQAFGINDAEQIVGDYSTIPGAFIPQGYLMSNGVFRTINYPGASATQVFGINNSGDIVGQYWADPGDTRGYGFLATPCQPGTQGCTALPLAVSPEPSSLLMLGTVVLGLMALIFRRNMLAYSSYRLRRSFPIADVTR